MNTETARGHIEHYYARILSAIREIEDMFPTGQATQQEYLASRERLLKLFHQMGNNAEKIDWHKPVYPSDSSPCEHFAEFAPDRLDSKKFSFGYFQRCMEDTIGNADWVKILSLLAGEEDSKYSEVKEERKRKRDTLQLEYSEIRMKCWFWAVVLWTLLLGISGVLAALAAWWFYFLFIPPAVGALPLGRIVLLSFKREVTVEEAETAWNQTRLDVIWSGIRDIDNEIEFFEKNQTIWVKWFDRGRYGIAAGVVISAVMLPYFVICC